MQELRNLTIHGHPVKNKPLLQQEGKCVGGDKWNGRRNIELL